MKTIGLPKKQGLYDPCFEHDACGVGFVTNIKGKKSHEIVQQAITVLANLDHRGAVGSEHNTGDGAGIDLPAPGHYGVAMLFTSPEATERSAAKHLFQHIITEEAVEVIGWREV